MRYFIRLSYSGAGFHGWQIQPRHESVQAALEKALTTLLRTKTTVTGAGRTDTGVNATGYVAHFDADRLTDAKDLAYKLNAILPPQIAVLEIGPASDDFHARFSASRREYSYFLHRVKDPFLDSFSYQCAYPSLDFGLMNEAASLLPGRHDFSCFEKTGADSRTSICTVFSAGWKPYAPSVSAWEPFPEGGEPRYWKFEITADRFLRNMVRAVTGTLLEVGRGKRSLENFSSLILPPTDADPAGHGTAAGKETAAGKGPAAGKSAELPARCAAGESVPGKALFLTRVEY